MTKPSNFFAHASLFFSWSVVSEEWHLPCNTSVVPCVCSCILNNVLTDIHVGILCNLLKRFPTIIDTILYHQSLWTIQKLQWMPWTWNFSWCQCFCIWSRCQTLLMVWVQNLEAGYPSIPVASMAPMNLFWNSTTISTYLWLTTVTIHHMTIFFINSPFFCSVSCHIHWPFPIYETSLGVYFTVTIQWCIGTDICLIFQSKDTFIALSEQYILSIVVCMVCKASVVWVFVAPHIIQT